MRYQLLLLAVAVLITPAINAQSVLSPQEVETILEHDADQDDTVSAPRHLLFCWSKPDHPRGTHSYERFAKTWTDRLFRIEGITAMAVEGFPNKAQWKRADLVVFNLTQKTLSPKQYKCLDNHLEQGKGIIVLHQGMVQRAGFDEWAERLGFAFSWEKGAVRSKWGKGELTISLDNSHPIFEGFPEKVRLTDELYWNLKKSTRGTVSVLGETPAPKGTVEVDGQLWPVFWTTEHPGEDKAHPGRVFCSVAGHFDGVQDSAFLELALTRAFAWCLDEPSRPFTKLVGQNEQGDQDQPAADQKSHSAGGE